MQVRCLRQLVMMRKGFRFWVTIGALSVASSLPGVAESGAPLDLSGFAPNTTLLERRDLGDIGGTAITHFEISYRNSGDSSRLILGIGSSCPYLSATVSRYRIPPGEDALISIVLDPAGIEGERNEHVMIDVLDDMECTEVVALRFNVTPVPKPHLTLEPGDVDLGIVVIGDSATFTVRVHNTGDADLILPVAPFAESSALAIEPGPNGAISGIHPGESVEWRIVFSPPANVNYYEEIVDVLVNDPSAERLRIRAYVCANDELKAALDRQAARE